MRSVFKLQYLGVSFPSAASFQKCLLLRRIMLNNMSLVHIYVSKGFSQGGLTTDPWCITSTLRASHLPNSTVCHSPYYCDIWFFLFTVFLCLSVTFIDKDTVFLIAFFTVTRRVHIISPWYTIYEINVIKHYLFIRYYWTMDVLKSKSFIFSLGEIYQIYKKKTKHALCSQELIMKRKFPYKILTFYVMLQIIEFNKTQ